MPKNFSYPATRSLKSCDKGSRPEAREPRRLRSFRSSVLGSQSVNLSKSTLNSIRLALKEDIGSGDVTSHLLIPSSAKGNAQIISKAAGVFSGGVVAQSLGKITGIQIKLLVKEGSALKKSQRVMELSGKVHGILKAERVLLNLIGHLSGIATQTAAFVQAMSGTKCKIIDTRKTTPLWRELEKAAVLAGGGFNHRFGLDDYILVKENHRRFGDLSRLTRSSVRGSRSFEIEVRDFDELMEAFDLGAEVAMLDHFTPVQAKKAVQLRNRISPQTMLEASGNMTLKTVRTYALAGVDLISVGALTHSVPAHDFSLLIK